MNFEVLTLFPDMMNAVFGESIIGRAVAAGKISVHCTDIRSYTKDKHRRVDDTPYGGGFGMVMQCQPAIDCIRDVKSRLDGSVRTIYMSPQGRVLTQDIVKELAAEDSLIILCGHYEGVDQRVLDELNAEEISVGDYVLTGGELPALILTDAIARLQDGVLPNSDAYSIESHYNGLLEHPQYTRPEIWHDRAVPAVLLTGAHDAVAKWQEETALEVTRRKRPDMLYDHRVNGEPYARYIRVFVPHKEREYDIVAFMKMIFHRRILTNREQKILKRMMLVFDSLPTPPECEENSRIWLNAKNAGHILDMYAPLFDMLREHGIDYRIEYSDTPDGKPVAENENFTVFA